MIGFTNEATSGHLNPSHPFIATAPTHVCSSPNLGSEGYQAHELIGEREDLASDYEYNDGLDDEMAELSDSHSSTHTSSRPVTPSHPAQSPNTIQIATSPRVRGRSGFKPSSQYAQYGSPKARTASLSNGNSNGNESRGEVFSLAHKAERILGLTPGTLAHARACLENARDEVRRTAQSPSHSPTPEPFDFSSSTVAVSTGGAGANKGMVERMQTRARKAMSVAGLSGPTGHAKMPSVVIGVGGKEEEERRERRRKAADGVIYWQREVGRLETELQDVGTIRRR